MSQKGQSFFKGWSRLGLIFAIVFLTTSIPQAAIYRWDNGEKISDLTLQPHEKYRYMNLSYADLSEMSLWAIRFTDIDLSYADFQNSNLKSSSFYSATVNNANFTGATIEGARFNTENGFTSDQLYSTASYQNKNLTRIRISGIANGWDLSNQNLNNSYLSGNFFNTNFKSADLTNSELGGNFTNADLNFANLKDACISGIVSGADFTDALIQGATLYVDDFTKQQLYATASYQEKDLSGIFFGREIDLSGFDLSHQDFTDACFSCKLTDTDFTGAVIQNAYLGGFTKEQLYSTASYQEGNLQGIELPHNAELAGVNFSEKDLSEVEFCKANLEGAQFQNANLNQTNMGSANLKNANFEGANLESIILGCARIEGANFENVRGLTPYQIHSTKSYIFEKQLRGVNLSRNSLQDFSFENIDLTNCSFAGATLSTTNLTGYTTKANFSCANIEGVDFSGAIGFTKSQLESTSSYQNRNLSHLVLGDLNLTGWDFSNQNLIEVDFLGSAFHGANLTDADFSNAVIRRVNFSGISGFAPEQLYSTQSYAEGDLQGVKFNDINLDGWNFSNQNLSGATFFQTSLASVDFTGATIDQVDLGNATGFTASQLYSTASYQNHNLHGVWFDWIDMSGWDLSGQDLSGASLYYADLTGTDFTGAIVHNTDFSYTAPWQNSESGMTAEQLYSTQSYQDKDLHGISLAGGNLKGWDFSGQTLVGANFYGAIVTDTDFTGAIIHEADFSGTRGERYQSPGLTASMLYSTQSYQDKDLHGIGWSGCKMGGWNLSGQNLMKCDFDEVNLPSNLATKLNETDLSGADTRGATLSDELLAQAGNVRNLIRPDGTVEGVDLQEGERLLVRDYLDDDLVIEVCLKDDLVIAPSGTLAFELSDSNWGSTVHFDGEGLTATLDGALQVLLAKEFAPTLGEEFCLFDWSGLESRSGGFALFDLPQLLGGLGWDVSGLYTTGAIRVVAVPEPGALVLLFLVAISLGLMKRRKG